jgi:hypothetical protein
MVQEMLTTASFAPTAHCNGLLGTVSLARVVPSLLALLVVYAAALGDYLIRANRILQWVFARYRVYWLYWYKSTNTDVEEALLVEMLTTAVVEMLTTAVGLDRETAVSPFPPALSLVRALSLSVYSRSLSLLSLSLACLLMHCLCSESVRSTQYC